MSKNVAQVYAANPITTIGNTDVLYVVQTDTTDAAINGANLKAMFVLSTLGTDNAVITTNATGVITAVALSDGQVIIGSSAGAPGAANISAGSGISIVNGHNTITISSSGGGMTWSTVTGTSQAAAINQGYFANNAGLVSVTLPAIAPIGSVVSVVAQGAGGFSLIANTGQVIQFGDLASSSGGSFSSAAQYDTINVVCMVANTTWLVLSAVSSGLIAA